MTKLAKKNNSTKYALKYLHPNVKNWGALAMMAGEKKYGAWNFLDGHKLTDLLDAMERHIDRIREGEWIDTDCTERLDRSVPHLGCIVAGVNMIAGQLAKGTLIDDRHRYLDKMAGDFDVLPAGAIEDNQESDAVTDASTDMFQLGARWERCGQVRTVGEETAEGIRMLRENSEYVNMVRWTREELYRDPIWIYLGPALGLAPTVVGGKL